VRRHVALERADGDAERGGCLFLIHAVSERVRGGNTNKSSCQSLVRGCQG